MITGLVNEAWCDEHGEMDYHLTGDGRIAWVMCYPCRAEATL